MKLILYCKNKYNWIGPAFIIDKHNQISLEDIKDYINIELKYEQFALVNFIVYPRNLEDYTKINYPNKMPNFNNNSKSEYENEDADGVEFDNDEILKNILLG